jgi:hypothetical protein
MTDPARSLYEALRALEHRAAVARRKAGASASRREAAAAAGEAPYEVKLDSRRISSWVPGDLASAQVPRSSDADRVWALIRVWSDWAGDQAPDRQYWVDLIESAQLARAHGAAKSGTTENKKPVSAPRDATDQRKPRWKAKAVTAAGAAVLAAITGIFTPLGQGLVGLAGSSAPTSRGQNQPSAGSPSSGSPASVEDFHAHADWCCQIATVVATTGFYWAGTPGSLDTTLHPTQAGATTPALMPGGVGLIEIPVQSSGTEPILVAPPKVIVRSRGPNIAKGMIAILPRGGQGGGSPGEFEADVDNAAPVTVPFGASGSASSYQYVSANSAEVLTLYVVDANYYCTFDVELTWREQGRSHTTLLTNNGKHFRIAGSAGLSWYAGDPRMGVRLTRVPPGQPFSHYAPK